MDVECETYDYDPGHIEGKIVVKHKIPITNLVRTGYTWEEQDIGDWRGPHNVQVPVIEEVVVGYKTVWKVFTPEQYARFVQRFESQN